MSHPVQARLVEDWYDDLGVDNDPFKDPVDDDCEDWERDFDGECPSYETESDELTAEADDAHPHRPAGPGGGQFAPKGGPTGGKSPARAAGNLYPPHENAQGTYYSHDNLVHHLTRQDIRRDPTQTKHPYALAHELGAAQRVRDEVNKGEHPGVAFSNAFNPTRGNHGIAKRMNLGLDVQHGQWVLPAKASEVAPPGWSGTVKAMKSHKDIDNPFALAWAMHNRGDSPHIKPEKKAREAQAIVVAQARFVEAMPASAGMSLLRTGVTTLPDVPVQSFRDDLQRKISLRRVMVPHDDGQADDGAVQGESRLPQTDPRVNYRYASDKSRSCSACTHFQAPGGCERVTGMVRPVDVCDLFEPEAEPRMAQAVFVTAADDDGAQGDE